MSRKARRPVNPTELARSLAHQRHLWVPLVDFDPITRYYALISSSADLDAWLLTWLPGQGTDWHDHGEGSGSYVVLQGALTEQEATAGGGDQRLRPGQTPGRLIRSEQRSFGRRYVHRLTNLGLDPAVSLHVCTPRLTVMTPYAERDGFLHPAATQREGVSW